MFNYFINIIVCIVIIQDPVLFSIFLYDIFHFTTSSTFYNYADDNIDKVVEHLEKDSLALIEWFSCNQIKANHDKYQDLAIGKKSMDKNIVFDLAGNYEGLSRCKIL
jgi:hypothetical protein